MPDPLRKVTSVDENLEQCSKVYCGQEPRDSGLVVVDPGGTLVSLSVVGKWLIASRQGFVGLSIP